MAQAKPDPLSPLWWLQRLYEKIKDRQAVIEVFDDYYSGNHPLPWLAPGAREEFRLVLKMMRSNYMGLVCDAMVERMAIEGFRVGDNEEGDSAAWRLWQLNNMDSEHDKGLLEASIGGTSYLHVAPNTKKETDPFIWIEHASQCIVEYDSSSNRRKRIASLKVYQDEWTGDLFATLQLAPGATEGEVLDATEDEPCLIFKWRAKAKANGSAYLRPDWKPRQVRGEDWPLVNTLGEVSMFESPNNPRLLIGGVSELIDLIDIQDRVNKTIADRLVTQDFGAFPQKFATGWPVVNAVGQKVPQIEIGRNRMITTDSVSAELGQFQAAPLDPYSNAKREDVKDIASRSRTPAQYLLGEMSNVNGDTLKASESGLVSKVRQRSRGHSDPAEDAMRLLRKAAGITPATGEESMEAIWRNPEFRTEGELTDALVKMSTLHVPDKALWARWGATPKEIASWEAMQLDQARRNNLLAQLADSFRTSQVTSGQTDYDTSRGSVSDQQGRDPNGKFGRDADGDGVIGERSNRVNLTSQLQR